jgi:hypothetical protein
MFKNVFDFIKKLFYRYPEINVVYNNISDRIVEIIILENGTEVNRIKCAVFSKEFIDKIGESRSG